MKELHLFNPEKYNRQSIRYPGYDYSQPGHYFITICTKERECIFGEIKNGIIGLSDIGIIVQNEWLNTSKLRQNIILDEFIIMPNHIHGIIEITHAVGDSNVGIDCNQSLPDNTIFQRQPHPFGPQSNNLFAIIRGFKGSTTKQINTMTGNTEGGSIWQSRFYDVIIDTDDELNIIRNYIKNNPNNWNTDRNNPRNSDAEKSKQNTEIPLKLAHIYCNLIAV